MSSPDQNNKMCKFQVKMIADDIITN